VAGTIRRVFAGIYHYPRYTEFLGETLLPTVEGVAEALDCLYPLRTTSPVKFGNFFNLFDSSRQAIFGACVDRFLMAAKLMLAALQ
jgi:hypothetical protein